MKKRKFRYILLALILLLVAGMYRVFKVEGWSDIPGILDKSKVIVNMAAYDIPVPYTLNKITRIRNPERNDIVLFRIPEQSGNNLVIKRVVGIPGDLIEIRNHKLMINGKEFTYVFQLNSDYVYIPQDILKNKLIAIEKSSNIDRLVTLDEKDNKSANFGPLLIPDKHYFILGDNRSNSQDSRHYGVIPRENILGNVIKVFGKN